MNLVIVESPSKTKTIGKYLGNDYKVVSSKGHVRDLATSGKFGLGIDVENDFKPTYIPIPNKKKVISDLKHDVKESSKVYLATDPDREGEAISWHLKDVLGIKDENYERILFNEITESAVKNAIKNPKRIDFNLVKSQETRRMLDRIIGFRLSKLMQSKTSGTSAGRVQSVALKLIVDREREILDFVPEEYWTITAKFDDFESILEKYNNKKIELKDESDADKVLGNLSNKFIVKSIEEKEKNKKGVMPFITSTLEQACANKFNYSSTKTMKIAQALYEGKDIGSETVGLISYMRTDSTRLSDTFVSSAKEYIKNVYGSNYVGSVKVSKKKENVQDAHEAIRPTSINRTPETIKEYLTNDEYKVYSIIYYRTLASLMKDAKVKQTSVILDNNGYEFKTTGQVTIFDGFMKVYKDYMSSEEKFLPNLSVNEELNTENIDKEQHFTKPVSRYTEASLIKEMESLGIGRPSTYAKTMDTLKERDYVTIEDKKFIPTSIGFEITDKLQEFFSNIINVEYTANMEQELDEIADDKLDNVKVLKSFFSDFEPLVENAFSKMEKVKPTKTGEVCPNCGNDLVIRKGKYGEFTACSNYPECKYIKQEEKVVVEICDCPICKKGKIVERKTRKGKVFYGCNNYPKCKTAAWDIPTGNLCPECNNLLVSKNNIVKCSNCDYSL